MSQQNQTADIILHCTGESTSSALWEHSLTCPLCAEQFDTNLEVVTQAQARRATHSSSGSRRPLLTSESRLPVSCTSCWYTFCNACLHRLMYRPGGTKCPICPHTEISVADPPINKPLVELLGSLRAMVETSTQRSAQASIQVKVVIPTEEKRKTAMKAKKTKAKTEIKSKEEQSSSSVVEEHRLLQGDVYLVHAIVGRRIRDRQRWYKVRWVGFSEQHDTWELWTNLRHLDIRFHRQMMQLDDEANKDGR